MKNKWRIIEEIAVFFMLFALVTSVTVSKKDTDSDASEISVTVVEATTAESSDPMGSDVTLISVEEDTTLSESTDSADSNGNPNPGIIPPNSQYEKLNAEWFKWAFSMPWDETNPLYDPVYETDNMDSSQPLPGNVVFLGSSFDSSDATGVNREITVSTGTRIFIPIFNVEASEIEGNGETEEELQDSADSWMGEIEIISVTIDGEEVENPEQYVAPSGAFTYDTLADGNVLEALYGLETEGQEGTLSAANGYYLLLPPLPPGEHTIHFVTGGAFPQDVTYVIIVEPGNDKSAGENGNGKNKA